MLPLIGDEKNFTTDIQIYGYRHFNKLNDMAAPFSIKRSVHHSLIWVLDPLSYKASENKAKLFKTSSDYSAQAVSRNRNMPNGSSQRHNERENQVPKLKDLIFEPEQVFDSFRKLFSFQRHLHKTSQIWQVQKRHFESRYRSQGSSLVRCFPSREIVPFYQKAICLPATVPISEPL